MDPFQLTGTTQLDDGAAEALGAFVRRLQGELEAVGPYADPEVGLVSEDGNPIRSWITFTDGTPETARRAVADALAAAAAWCRVELSGTNIVVAAGQGGVMHLGSETRFASADVTVCEPDDLTFDELVAAVHGMLGQVVYVFAGAAGTRQATVLELVGRLERAYSVGASTMDVEGLDDDVVVLMITTGPMPAYSAHLALHRAVFESAERIDDAHGSDLLIRSGGLEVSIAPFPLA